MKTVRTCADRAAARCHNDVQERGATHGAAVFKVYPARNTKMRRSVRLGGGAAPQAQTSALAGHSVQDVRRGLDALRAARRDGSLVLTSPFMYGMTAVEFASRVVVGQHRKRQDKRQRRVNGRRNP